MRGPDFIFPQAKAALHQTYRWGAAFQKRLNGVEPSHMPPEGIALSTELQTHSGLFKKAELLLEQP